jgi:hypothetical protein
MKAYPLISLLLSLLAPASAAASILRPLTTSTSIISASTGTASQNRIREKGFAKYNLKKATLQASKAPKKRVGNESKVTRPISRKNETLVSSGFSHDVTAGGVDHDSDHPSYYIIWF